MKTNTFLALSVAFWATSSVQGLPPNPEVNDLYFQGDIRLTAEQALDLRNGIIGEHYRWPDGVVAYVLEDDFGPEYNAIVMRGMQEYENRTNGCIKFRPRTDEANYVAFKNRDEGCSSYVGMIGGRQEINYATSENRDCFLEYGTIVHEMLHALGFYHEQSRTDRDEYVIINWGNIQPGKEENFYSYGADVITDFGVAYDYGSVMHYKRTHFSIDGVAETITPKDPDAVIGQRIDLSESDWQKLYKMYKCPQ